MSFLKRLFGSNAGGDSKSTTNNDLDKQLIDAVSKGNLSEIERLIKNGADVNAKDQFIGGTVLHHALSSHNPEVTKLLLSFGASPNESNEFGEPVLIKAALANQHEVVKVLLENGAAINIKDRKGNTALFVAVKEGQGWKNVVEVLVAGGASPEEVGPGGESAIGIARRCGFDQLMQVLAPSSIEAKITGTSQYVEECLHPPFDDLPEERDWATLPQARDVIEAGNSGQREKAVRLASEFRNEMPDFDFPYNWLAHLFVTNGDLDSALRIVEDGLRHARTKSLLCTRMARVYLEKQDIREAVKWWIRSAALQMRSGSFLLETWPYLAEAARALGLAEAETFLRRRSGGNTLTGGPADTIHRSVNRMKREPGLPGIAWIQGMADAIESLVLEDKRKLDTHIERLRELAPNGVYCILCKSRYSIDECVEPRVPEGRIITFICPKCKVPRAYDPSSDKGL